MVRMIWYVRNYYEYWFNNKKMYLLATQVGTGIHTKTTSTTAEAVTLRAEFTSVADFAEEFTFVLGAVGGVQQLSAETYEKLAY